MRLLNSLGNLRRGSEGKQDSERGNQLSYTDMVGRFGGGFGGRRFGSLAIGLFRWWLFIMCACFMQVIVYLIDVTALPAI